MTRFARRWPAVVVLTSVLGLLTTIGRATAQPAPQPPGGPDDCGEGCLWPQPQPQPPPQPAPADPPAPSGSGGLGGWLNEWLWSWFTDLVSGAMSWLPEQLARSMLATPELSRTPVIGQVWTTSQHLMLASYGLLITIAGVLVMAYQTVQLRSSIKDILPRLLLAFLAANLSLFFGDKMITVANAFSQAILGDDVGAEQAARVFTDTVRGNIPDSDGDFNLFYLLFTIVVLIVMMIAVLLTFVVRVMLTVVLLISAPLVLMAHALPQTHPIAAWWWKAFSGVLVVQVAQSLTFLAAVKLFYMPGGISLF